MAIDSIGNHRFTRCTDVHSVVDMTSYGTPTPATREQYMAELEPTPEQLSSPRGTPLTTLSWADVQTRVAEAEDFLLATTDPDGRPHVVPVLGVWLDGAVCFVTA